MRALTWRLGIALVLFVVTGASCPGPQGESKVTLALLPIPTGTVERNGVLVLPVGDPANPVAVASASNERGVASLRIVGTMSFSCHPAGPAPAVSTQVAIDQAAAVGTTLPTDVLTQVDLSERGARARCGGDGNLGFVADLKAVAAFPDPKGGAPIVHESPPLRVRYRTLAMATLNVIGVDATATAPENDVRPFGERVGDLASAIAPYDVVALQELESRSQADDLATRAGFPFLAHAVLEGGHWPNRGVAVLSRHPIDEMSFEYAPWVGCVFNCPHHHAAMLAVTVHPAGAAAIRVVNTHFWGGGGDGNPRDEWRAAQAAYLRATYVDPSTRRVVVMGDFNGNGDLVRPAGPLSDAFDAAVERAVVTGTGHDVCPDRIDGIYVDDGIGVLRYDGVGPGCPYDVTRDVRLSDHPMIVGLLAF